MDLERPSALRAPVYTRSGLVLAVYVAAVFTSALLLFGVQPMFTRMVLPTLGGSPAVWSVAMVFFQAMLLAGYAYAHVLTHTVRPPLTVAIHLGLMIVASFTLPLSIAKGWGQPPETGEALWLLGLFTLSIGLPFFALSANNPLLQAWFVRTGHRDGHDPYFLYAASNVGSFLALLSYPFLLEPLLSLRLQVTAWSAGFFVLFGLIAACGVFLMRAPAPAVAMEHTLAQPAAAPRWADVARWVFLAAVPSGLLIAVTAHISTDVAAAPLLWVMPLSLYLITWVLVFQSRPLIQHRLVLFVEPFAIVGLVVMFALSAHQNLVLTLAVHLAAFFVIAMACHGELARLRPHPRWLTGFYLALSLGGVVGGLFAGMAAPKLFSWIAEYPILVVLAILCRPFGPARGGRALWLALAAVGVAVLVPGLVGFAPGEGTAKLVLAAAVAVALASLLVMRDPVRFAALIAVAIALPHLYPVEGGRFESVRSFFGVHKIQETPDLRHRVLMHGTTIHGAQKIRDEAGRPVAGRPEPLTYYHAESPMAEAIAAIRERKGGPIRVAAIGLGTGSLACHRAEGENWRFFEIDPEVVRIARDPRRFTFLRDCAPDLPIVLGDARFTLAEDPGGYDLVIVDAFSSDSIPIHLLTEEAMAIYKAKLAPQGAVVMHVSNRHLELASVVAGIAAANGLQTWVNYDEANEDRGEEYIFSSTVAISAARPQDIGVLTALDTWEPEAPDPAQRTWTDDYSNIIGAVWRQMF
ncbi:MAG TPA: fused MFS/spermidine synthase [Beijerinckiaceae bacterium]|nr:fused MFS/spermidine synthase [Beijerinckiaceae bacterium]